MMSNLVCNWLKCLYYLEDKQETSEEFSWNDLPSQMQHGFFYRELIWFFFLDFFDHPNEGKEWKKWMAMARGLS